MSRIANSFSEEGQQCFQALAWDVAVAVLGASRSRLCCVAGIGFAVVFVVLRPQ